MACWYYTLIRYFNECPQGWVPFRARPFGAYIVHTTNYGLCIIFYYFCIYNFYGGFIMCDKIIKDKVINLRLTKNDYNLLKLVSSKKGMSLTHLITAIVLPYAVKQCTAQELINIYNMEI